MIAKSNRLSSAKQAIAKITMSMSSLYYIAPEFRENISHSQENIVIGGFGASPYVFIWLGN